MSHKSCRCRYIWLIVAIILAVLFFLYFSPQNGAVTPDEVQTSLTEDAEETAEVVSDVPTTPLPVGEYQLVVEKSQLLWEGGKKIGGTHNGFVPMKLGSLSVTDQGSTGAFTMDMTGIKATDIDSQKLDDHLKAEDFFDAATYPEAQFRVSSIHDGFVKGRLSLKGKEQTLRFPIEIKQIDDTWKVSGNTLLNREEWDIGNTMLEDQFWIGFEVVLQYFMSHNKWNSSTSNCLALKGDCNNCWRESLHEKFACTEAFCGKEKFVCVEWGE